MSARSLAVPVLCADCGKRLRGAEGVVPNRYHVRKHKDPATGWDCMGRFHTAHKLWHKTEAQP